MVSVIYSVWYEVESSIDKEWNEWMEKNHIPKVVKAGKFERARRYKVVEEASNKYVTFYESRDMELFKRYIEGPAKQLREEYNQVFGSKTKISRTVLVEI